VSEQKLTARSNHLISAEALQARLDAPKVKIIDATTHLVPSEQGGFGSVSGRKDYDDAHIPGALFFDLQSEMSDNASQFRFTVPPLAQFNARVSAAGIKADDEVIIYAGNHPMWACRMWWLFKVFGHASVKVLDGGLPYWQARGYPTTQAVPSVDPSEYQGSFNSDMVIDGDAIANTQPEGLCLLNALSPAQFVGEGAHYGRPGHIEGSRNTPYSAFLDRDQRFIDNAAMASLFEAVGVVEDQAVVTYCGGGIAASVPIFALALLGREDRVQLYDHSLSEWAANAAWPMVQG